MQRPIYLSYGNNIGQAGVLVVHETVYLEVSETNL